MLKGKLMDLRMIVIIMHTIDNKFCKTAIAIHVDNGDQSDLND